MRASTGQIDRVVEHHDHTRAEAWRPRLAQPLERERRVELVGGQERLRPRRPSARPAAVARPRRRRPASSSWRSVAPNGSSYKPGRSTRPDTQNSFVPGRRCRCRWRRTAGRRGSTIGSTLTSVSTLLTSVGRPNKPDLDGERRLRAGLAAVPLERVEQRRLLAADVGAGADAQLEVEVEAEAHHVGAQEAAAVGLPRWRRPPGGGRRVLAPQVDVAPLGADGEAGDGHRLDERERIALHHDPVLERARLALVGVGHDVLRAGRLPMRRRSTCDRSGRRRHPGRRGRCRPARAARPGPERDGRRRAA